MNKEFELGNKIKQLRKEMGLTQEQLAEKVGMDNKHLSKIENGLHLPTYKTIAKLAEVLKFNFDDTKETQKIKNEPSPTLSKALKILNSAKDNRELEYYLDVLKLAQKGLKFGRE